MGRKVAVETSLALALTLLLGAVAPLVAAPPPTAVEATVPVDVRVRARTVAPGEPLRVVVTATRPLERLGAEFLGADVHLSPSPDRRRWTGWTMVALDEEPQMAVLEVRGADAAGHVAAGTRAVTVHDKAFPEEALSVAPRYVEPPTEVAERLARERGRLDTIYRSRTPVTNGDLPFARPVAGGPTSAFGTRRVFNGKPRSPHSGLDLRADTGTEVRASGPGRVALSTDLYYSGNTVIVDHGGGLFTLYAHLSRLDVAEGAAVAMGTIVGLSGATGRVTGPHLHWGAKIGSRPFDPQALLDERIWR